MDTTLEPTMIEDKVKATNEVFKVIKEVGLPLFQSVALLGVILYLIFVLMAQAREDRQVILDQSQKFADVVEASTKSNIEMTMAIQSLEKKIDNR